MNMMMIVVVVVVMMMMCFAKVKRRLSILGDGNSASRGALNSKEVCEVYKREDDLTCVWRKMIQNWSKMAWIEKLGRELFSRPELI